MCGQAEFEACDGTPKRMLSNDGTFLKALLRRLNELLIKVLVMMLGTVSTTEVFAIIMA